MQFLCTLQRGFIRLCFFRFNNVLDIELSEERLHSLYWCACTTSTGENGCCSTASETRSRSCYCCKEAGLFSTACARKLQLKVDGYSCITLHPDFHDIALNKTVRYARYFTVSVWIRGRTWARSVFVYLALIRGRNAVGLVRMRSTYIQAVRSLFYNLLSFNRS